MIDLHHPKAIGRDKMIIRERHSEIVNGFMWQATEVINASRSDFLDGVAEAGVTGSVGAMLIYHDVNGDVEKQVRVSRVHPAKAAS